MIETMTSPRERPGRFDWVIAAVGTALAIAYMSIKDPDSPYDPSVVGALLFGLVAVPLLWRRVAPVQATLASLAVLVAHWALYPDAVRCGIVLPIAFLYVYASGARLDRDASILGLVASLALATVCCATDGPNGADVSAMAFVAPIAIGIWGIGRFVHSRGKLVDELQVRTTELRETRDERARLEVATDRARLSGELDALLQRRLGELARLADEGSHQDDPAAAASMLEQIERESRETLNEMREVVGVLRTDEVPVSPQPTLTHMEAMLMRAKGGGARLHVEGNPRALPAGVELSAYRIVEQLLDAMQDAAGVEVTVRFADDALELTVAGPVKRRADQLIERARERARLQSGTLEATTSGGRAEAVVSLPIYATV